MYYKSIILSTGVTTVNTVFTVLSTHYISELCIYPNSLYLIKDVYSGLHWRTCKLF